MQPLADGDLDLPNPGETDHAREDDPQQRGLDLLMHIPHDSKTLARMLALAMGKIRFKTTCRIDESAFLIFSRLASCHRGGNGFPSRDIDFSTARP